MKKLFYIAVMMLMCTSCFKNSNCDFFTNIKGHGPRITREYDLKDFDALRISGGIDVSFQQADTFRVAFRALENIFEHIDISVEGSTLVARPDWEKANCHFFLSVNHQGMHLTVYAPRLHEIVMNGNGDFDIRDGYVSEDDLRLILNSYSGDVDLSDIHVNTLAARIDGSGDVNLSGIQAKTLIIKFDGSGDLYVSGETEESSLSINGNGDVDTSNLKVNDPEKRPVHVAGNGDTQLRAKELIK